MQELLPGFIEFMKLLTKGCIIDNLGQKLEGMWEKFTQTFVKIIKVLSVRERSIFRLKSVSLHNEILLLSQAHNSLLTSSSSYKIDTCNESNILSRKI